MPISRYAAQLQGVRGEVFSHLPFDQENKDNAQAEDGVSCSICHQISKEKLGTRESFNGGVFVKPPSSPAEQPPKRPLFLFPGPPLIIARPSGGVPPPAAGH